MNIHPTNPYSSSPTGGNAPSGHSVSTSTKNRIGLATGCLYFSAALYGLIGVITFPAFVLIMDSWVGVIVGGFICMFSLALAGGILFVVQGLRRRKYWAWIAGLCIFGIFLTSIFFPIGALGLWGLLDSGSQAEFGVGIAKNPNRPQPPTNRF